MVETSLIFPRRGVNHLGRFRLVLAGLGWFSLFPSFCVYSRSIWIAKVAKNLTIKARKHFQCNVTVRVACETKNVHITTA